MNLAHLEAELDIEIYGLIGYEMLHNYDVLLNYQDKEMVLIEPNYFNSYRSKKLSEKSLERVSFTLNRHIPVLETTINKQTFDLALDMGAESNLLDEKLYANLKNQLRNEKTDNLIGADKDAKRVITGELKALYIENNKFKDLMTVFNDISHFDSGYSLSVDGIIGYEVLSKDIVVISYNHKELIFIK